MKEFTYIIFIYIRFHLVDFERGVAAGYEHEFEVNYAQGIEFIEIEYVEKETDFFVEVIVGKHDQTGEKFQGVYQLVFVCVPELEMLEGVEVFVVAEYVFEILWVDGECVAD